MPSVLSLALASIAVRNTAVLAVDAAPVVASTATALSTLLAGLTWYGAQRTKRSTRDVDAIRVTQETMLSTIEHLREENAELRRRLAAAEQQVRECQQALGLGPTRRKP